MYEKTVLLAWDHWKLLHCVMTVHVNCWIVALYNNGSCANKDAKAKQRNTFLHLHDYMSEICVSVHLFIDLVHECTPQPVAPAQSLSA